MGYMKNHNLAYKTAYEHDPFWYFIIYPWLLNLSEGFWSFSMFFNETNIQKMQYVFGLFCCFRSVRQQTIKQALSG